MSLLGDGELAVTESVPQLNCAVAGSGNNLSVIGREGNGKDVVVVSNKSAGGGTSGKLPKAESLVPGCGKSVSTIGGDHLEIKVSAFNCNLQIALLIPGATNFEWGFNIHSQKQCESDRGEISLGIRMRSHPGSSSR